MDEYEKALADEGYESPEIEYCPRCGKELSFGGHCKPCSDELLEDALALEDEIVADEDDGDEDLTCWKCGGSGLDMEGLGDCEYCDGYGYKWWMD